MATPLTDSINALTAYANEVTGASDTNLSDAVHTLASGYGQGGGEVPNGYTRLLYLESSGTQGIDTGKHGKLNSKFIIDCCFVPHSPTYYEYIFGSADPTMYGFISSNVPSFTLQTTYWKFGNSSEKNTSLIVYQRGLVEVTKDYGTYTDRVFSSIIRTTQIGGTSVTEKPNNHLGLFCRGNNGTFDRFATCRIYEYWYYEGDTLIQHMIPVKRKSDNVLGMYDLVEDVFYTNIGTGTFIEGAWT